MQTSFKFFVSCLVCFVLSLLSGCGSGGGNGGSLLNSTPSLTPAEQADVDRYIKEDGRNAILQYLMYRRANDTDEIALKYVKYFVSQGADVNAKDDMGRTPLGLARGRTDIIKYLASVGAK